MENSKNDTKAWCSTLVDDSGFHTPNHWGYCEPSCQIDKSTEGTCLATPEKRGTIKKLFNQTYPLKPKAKVPCVFPFKFNYSSHNTCIKGNRDFFWCATSVDDESLYWRSWGRCSELCPNDEPKGKGSTIMISILVPTISLIILGIIIYLWLRRKQNIKELGKFYFFDNKCTL